MDKEQMKQLVIQQIDRDRDAILALGKEIYQHPETGYREVRKSPLWGNWILWFAAIILIVIPRPAPYMPAVITFRSLSCMAWQPHCSIPA